jgi:hypothetical protein
VLVGNATVAAFAAAGQLGRLRLRLASLGIALRRARDRMRLLLLWASHLLSLWLRGWPGLLGLLRCRPGLLRLLPWRGPGLPLLRCWPLLLGGPRLLRVPGLTPLRIGGKVECWKQERYCNWE